MATKAKKPAAGRQQITRPPSLILAQQRAQATKRPQGPLFTALDPLRKQAALRALQLKAELEANQFLETEATRLAGMLDADVQAEIVTVLGALDPTP